MGNHGTPDSDTFFFRNLNGHIFEIGQNKMLHIFVYQWEVSGIYIYVDRQRSEINKETIGSLFFLYIYIYIHQSQWELTIINHY